MPQNGGVGLWAATVCLSVRCPSSVGVHKSWMIATANGREKFFVGADLNRRCRAKGRRKCSFSSSSSSSRVGRLSCRCFCVVVITDRGKAAADEGGGRQWSLKESEAVAFASASLGCPTIYPLNRWWLWPARDPGPRRRQSLGLSLLVVRWSSPMYDACLSAFIRSVGRLVGRSVGAPVLEGHAASFEGDNDDECVAYARTRTEPKELVANWLPCGRARLCIAFVNVRPSVRPSVLGPPSLLPLQYAVGECSF
ncbi:unnamed protein product [Soboliphyme baturini]|uniref:Uncharacterized protein n=1 Tax=Soboliphyme baturini TaxID=241478 RepID=A0A183IQP9_9BILA|nr:unnamed protein product [Soboliphyme baturini]